ncbi:hypothetical protein SETIT_5G421500v2 [Setaria italica]|uniref:Uncharacterized protein n=1 Tax=Setaria italica TaxID=4555 RepID=A0A368REN0_SETIT|nr:hypothetical protein SETIT_5G421500v2 [Setaria italica]
MILAILSGAENFLCVHHVLRIVSFGRKVSRKSFEENESNVDHMEHYKYVLSKLLRGQDDSFRKGGCKEVQGGSTQNKGKDGNICNRTFPLFTEPISGLSNNDKERIKLCLHEIITFLNNDVDEVDQDIKAMEERGETCQDTVKKLSTGLLGKLGKMAQGVDDLLNTAASKCRMMRLYGGCITTWSMY